MSDVPHSAHESTHLTRGLGVWQGVALNVTMIVGAGVFATIPLMLGKLPGPYALWGWIGAGILILLDGMVWCELGAALPRSGGSYHYLLEAYGRDRWGRLMAFLFLWQFLVSGPLELGSGLAALAEFATGLDPRFADFNKAWTTTWVLWEEQKLTFSVGPAKLLGFVCGVVIIFLLYRNINDLGRLTITFGLGVLAAIAWILMEGLPRFSADRAFDYSGAAATFPADFLHQLGPCMILAMYSYLGYYNICYVGDEVHDPGRTIPRAILYSSLMVVVLFCGVHLALLGTVAWQDVPTDDDTFSLAAEFMKRVHGPWAVTLISVLLMWCCVGSFFAGLLGYSRIPYGAARSGHFFAFFDKVHPVHRIPHRALLFVGGLSLVWSFFDLTNIINALVTTRILEQFVGQAIGVLLLRRTQPDLPRPYRMPLYPLPCLLALAGWLYLYLTADPFYIVLGLATLAAGVVVFVLWSPNQRASRAP
jgi:APA family basic amino acid/polyamine antiporter